MQKRCAIIAGISLIIALAFADSPLWGVSFVATAVMGVATFKGQLWDYKE